MILHQTDYTKFEASLLSIILSVVIFLMSSSTLQAEEILVRSGEAIPATFEYFEDVSSELGIDEIQNLPEMSWNHVASASANFGMTPSAYWIRFAVRNQESHSVNLIAELDYSQLDEVSFFVFLGKSIIHQFTTGDTHPFYPREVDHPNMLLRFNLEPDQVKTVYARVSTQGSMILPLSLWRENNLYEAIATEQKLHFFYYGSMTVIILINLAVFLTLREKLYLFYALAISGYLLFFASILGFSFQHLYPNYPALHSRALLTSMPILAFFSVLFCREFLSTKVVSPKLDIALRMMMYFEIFNFIAALTFSYNIAIMISAISAFFFFSVLFIAGPISWAAGVRAGIFFTLAWIPLTGGVLATAGRSLGIFPESFVAQFAMQIGSGLEAFILTLALADRLYREREQKIEAQADSLRKEMARNEAHNKLTEAMICDPVTGLPNRNQFERMVNEQLIKDPNGTYYVGVARISRLDEISRTLGLSRSERILKQVANKMLTLASQLPGVVSVKQSEERYERVYQLSGDCFGILVNPGLEDDVFNGLAKALKILAEPVSVDHLAIDLHPKFGAASYPAHGDNAALLIRNAHVGMEITPHARQEVGVYSSDYDIYSEGRLTLMSDLRDALQQNYTQLYYQPKLSLKTGKIIGLEALIRWHHPHRGWVYPDEFIPLAEETGVISQLTHWALEQGVKDLVTLLEQHPDLGVAINISARDLLAGGLVTTVESLLSRYSLSAEKLTLELTETAAMEDPDKGLAVLNQLTALGVKISIDDFGSGYSSLSYLKKLPATEIKLDRTLIMDVCSSNSSKVLVETAINMAHGLGYKLVAEGVEEEPCVELLKQMNCDSLQGYWLCKPLPFNELQDWLHNYQQN